MNKFFLSITSHASTVKKSLPGTECAVRDAEWIAIAPATAGEVAGVIAEMQPKRSTDIDGLSTWLIKLCQQHIIQPLTDITNLSFVTGVFPNNLKKAKVIPCFKKDDPTLADNYRPISILSPISKLIEKIFLKRLLVFLEEFKILSNSQFGFRKGKSTTDAIIDLVQYVVEGLDRRQSTLGVFLDLSKAFDCVDHGVLLNKLKHYGVRGTPLKWLESYLTDRTQQVQVNGKLSRSGTIMCGVPQGSILGPVLFILYVNDLPKSLTKGHMVQYADDTTLLFQDKDIAKIEIETFENGNSCIQQLSENNLKTNVAKSTFIYFFGRNALTDCMSPSVNIGETSIEEEDEVKFLGMHLDKGLTWDVHVDKVCAKISSGIYVLRSLATYCDQRTLLMAYYGLIYPHMAFGVTLWGSCSLNNIQRVFVLQKKAVRIIANLKFRESCRDTFSKLNILTLPGLYMYETVLYCRLKCNLTRGSDVHNYPTRACDRWRTSRHRLQAFAALPSVAGVRLLNHLPSFIKVEKDELKFKRNLKCFFTSGAYYSVAEYLGG